MSEKNYIYIFIYVYKTITGSEKNLRLPSETAFKALIVAIWNSAQKAENQTVLLIQTCAGKLSSSWGTDRRVGR